MTEIETEECPNCGSPKKPENFGHKPIFGTLMHLPSFLYVCKKCGWEFTFFKVKEVLLERKDLDNIIGIIGTTRTG